MKKEKAVSTTFLDGGESLCSPIKFGANVHAHGFCCTIVANVQSEIASSDIHRSCSTHSVSFSHSYCIFWEASQHSHNTFFMAFFARSGS